MEDGSLLQEVLHRHNSKEDALQNNSLILDVYYLLLDVGKNDAASQQQQQRDVLIGLAELAVNLNDFFQQHDDYPWFAGGDGPVFGVHTTTTTTNSTTSATVKIIPHLRAKCHYGVSVDDEWKAIQLLMAWQKKQQRKQDNGNTKSNIFAECWDVDDGKILLIETAEYLPQWVDRIGPENCRHRCWLQNGQLYLIGPEETEDDSSTSPLSLDQALELLRMKNAQVQIAPEQMQRQILHRAGSTTTSTGGNKVHHHRAAVVLPRPIARLFSKRPDLIHVAANGFVEQIRQQPPSLLQPQKQQQQSLLPDDSSSSNCWYEDWVWTTLSFGRTNYAMLRTMTSSIWPDADCEIPKSLETIEVRRLQRQCRNDLTPPHMRHAVALGVRLVVGLHHHLCHNRNNDSTRNDDVAPSSISLSGTTEQRILRHWCRIAREVSDRGGSSDGNDWIRAAWEAGPNQALHSLEAMLQCPVFDPEILRHNSITPLSHPGTSLAEQIWNGMKVAMRQIRSDREDDDDYPIPSVKDVDSESWMWEVPSALQQPEAAETAAAAAATTTTVASDAAEDVMEGVQSFIKGESSVEGVETAPVEINPTVFLNILLTTLQCQSAEELAARLEATHDVDNSTDDPFFSQEDYDLMDPVEKNEQAFGSTEAESTSDNCRMKDIMDAMDEELAAAPSRALDGDGVSGMETDIHVLSNLLKSLDAGVGGPGPMQSILNEMGRKAPNLQPSGEQDE